MENRMVNLKKKKINFFAKNYDSQNKKVSIFMNLSCVQESHFHTKSLSTYTSHNPNKKSTKIYQSPPNYTLY